MRPAPSTRVPLSVLTLLVVLGLTSSGCFLPVGTTKFTATNKTSNLIDIAISGNTPAGPVNYTYFGLQPGSSFSESFAARGRGTLGTFTVTVTFYVDRGCGQGVQPVAQSIEFTVRLRHTYEITADTQDNGQYRIRVFETLYEKSLRFESEITSIQYCE
jgi:hypothetical protein